MRVRSYIVLLTSGSLLGALSIGIFGWLTFQGLNNATNDLEKEAAKSGSFSTEHEDVKAFLSTARRYVESWAPIGPGGTLSAEITECHVFWERCLEQRDAEKVKVKESLLSLLLAGAPP